MCGCDVLRSLHFDAQQRDAPEQVLREDWPVQVHWICAERSAVMHSHGSQAVVSVNRQQRGSVAFHSRASGSLGLAASASHVGWRVCEQMV